MHMTSLMAPIPTEPITFTTPRPQSLCFPIASLMPSHPCLCCQSSHCLCLSHFLPCVLICPHCTLSTVPMSTCSGLHPSLSTCHPSSMYCPMSMCCPLSTLHLTLMLSCCHPFPSSSQV